MHSVGEVAIHLPRLCELTVVVLVIVVVELARISRRSRLVLGGGDAAVCTDMRMCAPGRRDQVTARSTVCVGLRISVRGRVDDRFRGLPLAPLAELAPAGRLAS